MEAEYGRFFLSNYRSRMEPPWCFHKAPEVAADRSGQARKVLFVHKEDFYYRVKYTWWRKW